MTKNKLTEIQKPVLEDLKEFNKIFKENIKSKVRLIDLITKYMLRQKGKKIRPLLVLLSAQVSGGVSKRSYRGATLVELLHTATLVHDDVVDSAEKRRGFPSLNAIWKNKISVLMGDFLLSRGLMIAVDGNDFDFLKIITNSVRRITEGELLQIYKTKKLDIDEKTYLKIISDKTASLLSTCCEIGAMSASENPKIIETMKNYGEYLGIAFQIKDDILDYTGKTKVIGKPLGGDIKEKKITLPLIYALQTAEKSESKKILKYIRRGENNTNVQDVINFVGENGGIEYALNVAQEYSKKAKDSISQLDSSQSKYSLEALVDFVVDRKN